MTEHEDMTAAGIAMLKKVNLNELSPDSKACFERGLAMVEGTHVEEEEAAAVEETSEEEATSEGEGFGGQEGEVLAVDEVVEPDDEPSPETEQPSEEEATDPATVDEAMDEMLEKETEAALKEE
ncbi:MAG: hypothetical protein ACYSW3_00355 [Planctomycetota bacterium]